MKIMKLHTCLNTAIAAATILAAAMAGSVNAQETPSPTSKQYSISPAIEFSGGGTSFGIKGRISNPNVPISVRPIVLFGYTPSVTGADFMKSVANGVSNLSNFAGLTADQKRAQVQLFYNVALTDPQANDIAKKLVAALSTPNPDSTQVYLIGRAKDYIARYDIETFKNLTPAQQQAQIKIFAPNIVDVATAATALNTAVTTPAPFRTPAQNQTISDAKGYLATAAATNLSGFLTLTPAQQSEELQIFSRTPLSDAQADVIATNLTTALANPTTSPNATFIASANQAIAYSSNTNAVGFTPGSGTAYGAAITYDFESADKKFIGYVGPRILFASGSNRIGNFDTSTSETDIGVLIGADYAISNDFIAGLSATYNFSKTGTLNVSGAGGFSGSAALSGSNSLDVGINFGYRF